MKAYRMETFKIPTRLRESFFAVCQDLRLDANRVLEQMMARFVAQPPRESLEEWAKDFGGDLKLSDDTILVDGISVKEYFSLSEEQRNALWEKWEKEAEPKLKGITARGVANDANTAG